MRGKPIVTPTTKVGWWWPFCWRWSRVWWSLEKKLVVFFYVCAVSVNTFLTSSIKKKTWYSKVLSYLLAILQFAAWSSTLITHNIPEIRKRSTETKGDLSQKQACLTYTRPMSKLITFSVRLLKYNVLEVNTMGSYYGLKVAYTVDFPGIKEKKNIAHHYKKICQKKT